MATYGTNCKSINETLGFWVEIRDRAVVSLQDRIGAVRKMGHTQSAAKNGGFTGVLPGEKPTKRVSTGPDAQPQASVVARPVETAIPVIQPPPHALLRDKHDAQPTTRRGSAGSSRPETPRRGGNDPQPAFAVPESVRKSHTLQQFEQTCSEILPGFLYVSNLHVAQDHTKLKALGVTHVINCCKEVVCFQPVADDSITYLQLALRDGVQEDLLPFFPQVIQFIEKGLQHDTDGNMTEKVLIHCHQGVSRSCAFAIAYVMYSTRCSFHEANALVKAKRSICSPNTAFICQLIEWERELVAASTPNTASYGLYRLASHAAYDPSTLVLKPCYYKDSRRKVSINPSDGSSHSTSEWLWSRGLFVYIDDIGQVVIWKGAHCGIQEGITLAKVHVETMLQVYAGEAAHAEMPIVVVEQQLDDVATGADAFGYAEELAWLEAVAAPATATAPAPSDGGQASQTEGVTTLKPMLFVLEGDDDHAWELISDYSSDDLLADSVLLLITPSESFLWFGTRVQSTAVDELTRLAAEKSSNHSSSTNLIVEHQDGESEAFWDAFEAGY